MLSSDVREIDRQATHLVGYSIKASLKEIIEKKLGDKLREQLAANTGRIADIADDGVYLVQLYDPVPFTPDTPFTQIVAKAVAGSGEAPEGMTAHTLPAGGYLRFEHRGPMNGIGASYDAMHRWLADNKRSGACPFDFEYWQDAGNLEAADTVITINLPAVDRPGGAR